MENEHEHGECECCGEHAKLHDGGLIVGGRDYGICHICDDCALPVDEYNALVAQIDARERTFDDISRDVNAYRTCYVGDGMCAPFNRECLCGWLRELDLTNEQINTFCDEHGIPHVA